MAMRMQTERSFMRKLIPMWFPARPLVAAVLFVALAAAAGFADGGHVAPAKAATKYTVFAGGGRGGISVDLFMPNVINVNQGDSIEFVNPYEEIHTITFLGPDTLPALNTAVPPITGSGPPRVIRNPKTVTPVPASGAANIDSSYANSGILARGTPATSWTATFNKLGSFEFVCIVHAPMTATVNVLSPGIYVASQAQRDAEAVRQLESTLAQAERISATARPGRTTDANGTSTWEVLSQGAPPGIAIQRFLPARLQVGVGDTVVFKNENPGPPHTVTFTSGAAVPDATTLEPQPSGPPTIVVNPRVSLPVKPSPNYEGTGYYNSGIISQAPTSAGGTSFSLTFTKAGTYPYVCVLHANQGMAGVVEVGGAAITPPSTGDAGLAALAKGASAWTLTGVTLLLFASGASFIGFRRAR
jgi:plastocyanin